MKVDMDYILPQGDELQGILDEDPTVTNQLLVLIALETLANRGLLSKILEALESEED